MSAREVRSRKATARVKRLAAIGATGATLICAWCATAYGPGPLREVSKVVTETRMERVYVAPVSTVDSPISASAVFVEGFEHDGAM